MNFNQFRISFFIVLFHGRFASEMEMFFFFISYKSKSLVSNIIEYGNIRRIYSRCSTKLRNYDEIYTAANVRERKGDGRQRRRGWREGMKEINNTEME